MKIIEKKTLQSIIVFVFTFNLETFVVLILLHLLKKVIDNFASGTGAKTLMCLTTKNWVKMQESVLTNLFGNENK